MINYKTVWTGPNDPNWYRVRGLSVAETNTDPETENISIKEEVTQVYCSGRIDWQHDADRDLKGSFLLPAMFNTDWTQFSNWLETIQTNGTWTLLRIVDLYEQTNPKINWDNYVEPKPVSIEPVYPDPGPVNIAPKEL